MNGNQKNAFQVEMNDQVAAMLFGLEGRGSLGNPYLSASEAGMREDEEEGDDSE